MTVRPAARARTAGGRVADPITPRQEKTMTDPTDRLTARGVRPIDEFHDEMMAKAEADHQKRLAAQPPADRAAVLTDAERKFLTFALDLAFDRMVSDDGFTDEDEAALKSLRRMADETPAATESAAPAKEA